MTGLLDLTPINVSEIFTPQQETRRKYAVTMNPPCHECRYYMPEDEDTFVPDDDDDEGECNVPDQEVFPKKCRHWSRARLPGEDGEWVEIVLSRR